MWSNFLDLPQARQRAATLLFRFSFLILVFSGLLFSITCIALLLGISVSKWQFPTAITISIGVYWWLAETKKERKWGVFIFLLLILLSALPSAWFYDVSFDGQMYHQLAIDYLKKGWNPYFTSLDVSKHSGSLWINHYPRFSWICGSTVFAITNNIEISKLFNWLLWAGSGCAVLSVILRITQLSTFQSIAASLLLIANPINLNTSLSSFVDGHINALMLVLFSSLIFIFIEKDLRLSWWTSGISIVLLINCKFTPLVYCVYFCAVFGLILLLFSKKHLFWRWFKISVAAGFLGVGVFGFNPYISNIINDGHIFHPLMGEKGKDIQPAVYALFPENFKNKNIFYKQFHSHFSTTGINSVRSPLGSKLKIPFTFTKYEIERYAFASVVTGGFGVWFGGILLITLLLLISIIIQHWHYLKKLQAPAIIVCFLLGSVLIMPEGWFARYAPQFWLIPIIILITCFIFTTKKWVRYLCYLQSIIIVVNLFLMCGYFYYNIMTTNEIRNNLTALKASKKTALVYMDTHYVNYLRFEKWGIPYKIVDSQDKLTNNKKFLYTTASVMYSTE